MTFNLRRYAQGNPIEPEPLEGTDPDKMATDPDYRRAAERGTMEGIAKVLMPKLNHIRTKLSELNGENKDDSYYDYEILIKQLDEAFLEALIGFRKSGVDV